MSDKNASVTRHPSPDTYMRIALSLARRNLGQTWPNPSVGAVIVKDGQIVGAGNTAKGGRPHAETIAIAQAGAQARAATLYVTLEPCCHHGQTPPCTDAILNAGISTVIIACKDPNPLMSGRGIDLLKNAGMEVIETPNAEARIINRGFFSVIEKKRPFIALKLATSLDGKIATTSGQSKWITGEKSRFQAHLVRSQYDAIATGIGTVLADDPQLTCRLPGLEDRSPVRIVFDRQGRLPADSQLAKTADKFPLWIMKSSIEEAMAELTQRGITRLLVEAGAQLSTAFLQSGLVDRIYGFRAPLIIGNEGLAAIGGGFPHDLAQYSRWTIVEQKTLDSDRLDILECLPAS